MIQSSCRHGQPWGLGLMVPVVSVLRMAMIGQLAQSRFLPITSSQIVTFLLEGGNWRSWGNYCQYSLSLAQRPRCQFALCSLSLRLLVLSILSPEHKKATNKFWWENKAEFQMKEKFLISPQDFTRWVIPPHDEVAECGFFASVSGASSNCKV